MLRLLRRKKYEEAMSDEQPHKNQLRTFRQGVRTEN